MKFLLYLFLVTALFGNCDRSVVNASIDLYNKHRNDTNFHQVLLQENRYTQCKIQELDVRVSSMRTELSNVTKVATQSNIAINSLLSITPKRKQSKKSTTSPNIGTGYE